MRHAREAPNDESLRFLHDGETHGRVSRWTWDELATRVTSTAAWLHELGLRRGDRALLMYPEGLSFAQVFLGCLTAGVVPVPVAARVAGSERGRTVLRGIVEVCEPRIALTTSAIARTVSPARADHLRIQGTDDLEREHRPWSGAVPDLDDVAFLQFTSGSTSAPKGVVVTHRNIAEHQRIVARTHRIHRQTHMISWLPTHHDMGLAGDFMMAVWSGRPLTMMSPTHFIERPMRWLEAISGQPGARSGGPNFAFALTTRKLDPEAVQRLDLSTWETAHCGAEPIRCEVLRAFAEALAPAGFHPSAFSLCYGMAEATLYVSDVRPWKDGFGAGAGELDGFAASGTTDGEVELAIVDTNGSRVDDGTEGEIWVRGPNVAAGYWRSPSSTEETFGAQLRGDTGGPWLRTGDLGRVVDGILYPTGRIKDLIIWRGQNLYPQDLELALEGAHPGLRPGSSAAFAVTADDGSEGIGLAAEVQRDVAESSTMLDEIMLGIRRAIGASFGVPVASISLLRPRALLKTTSGKVMRSANRAAIEDGSLEPVRSWASSPVELPSEEGAMSEVLRWVSSATGLPTSSIQPNTPLRDLGLDSLMFVELCEHLEARFGSRLQMKEIGSDPTPAMVCDLLRGAPPATEGDPPQAGPEPSVPAAPGAVFLPSPSWMRK